MSNQKKQIILNEISFWKKSKMLPEKYCDYLTTMYTEGNDEQVVGNAKESIKAKERSTLLRMLMTTITAAIVLIIALFFVPFTLATIIVVSIITLVFICLSFLYTKSKEALAVALQVAAAMLLLAITVRITSTYFEGNNIALYVGLISNCVFWLISGWKIKLPYFTFSGILGIVALIGYWLYQF